MPHALSFTRTSKICMFIDKGFAHRTCTKTLKTLHMMVRAETEFIDCCLLCVVLLIFCVVLAISTLQSNVMLQYNAQTETHQIRPPQNHYLFIFHVHVHEQSGRCVTCWQSILSIDIHELIKVVPYFQILLLYSSKYIMCSYSVICYPALQQMANTSSNQR